MPDGAKWAIGIVFVAAIILIIWKPWDKKLKVTDLISPPAIVQIA